MDDMAQRTARPELTLPEAEAALIREAYEGADVILEYGSGGSTVLASEMSDKRVYSVESDQAWSEMMQRWLDENPPADGTEVSIHWSDIGPTKEWGYPKTTEKHQLFARYPLKIWDDPEFLQPDVVLVDGRFRTGCAMATALRTKRPVTLYLDDYKHRRKYHRVERYFGAPAMTGRMAVFDVVPLQLPQDRLLEIVEMMTHP